MTECLSFVENGYLLEDTDIDISNQPLLHTKSRYINIIPLRMLNVIKHCNYRIYKTYSMPAKPLKCKSSNLINLSTPILLIDSIIVT